MTFLVLPAHLPLFELALVFVRFHHIVSFP
jgi:hypothetical protein